MRAAAIWMLLVTTVIGVVIWKTQQSNTLLGPYTAVGQIIFCCVAAGATVAVFFGIDRYFAHQPDYFRADRSLRMLELPRLQRTLKATDIEELVEVKRWYHGQSETAWTNQLAVLVRRAEGGLDYLPIVRVNTKGGATANLAGQLGELLHVPVRRIERTRRQLANLSC